MVREGRPTSCGCKFASQQRVRATTHGWSKTPEYNIWAALLQRCNNPNDKAYPHYGGRGITVCDRWNPKAGGSFENFLEDMGERPEGMSLERLNNDISYSKENCCWEGRTAQAFNRRIFKNNKSGHRGVYFHKRINKWGAQIKKEHKTYHLGCFDILEDAISARKLAEQELYFPKEVHYDRNEADDLERIYSIFKQYQPDLPNL